MQVLCCINIIFLKFDSNSPSNSKSKEFFSFSSKFISKAPQLAPKKMYNKIFAGNEDGRVKMEFE